MLLSVSLGTLFTGALITSCSSAQPKLNGSLLFHNYSSYESWDGQLYLVDLPSQSKTNLSKNWPEIKHAINGSFSADGKYITFMASQTDVEDWDVFVTHWNGEFWEQPINLTGPNGKRDEDPKFSPKNLEIIYKEDGIVAITGFDKKIKYFQSGSMPYFMPNGKDFLFERSGDIFLNKNNEEIKMYSGPGLSSYYPITLNDREFLYTRVQDSRHDAIMIGNVEGRKSSSLFFNNDQWDNSDPFPYENGKRYLFLVSGDYLVPKGGYNLVIADLKKKKIIDADLLIGTVNSDLEELGPNWSAHTYR